MPHGALRIYLLPPLTLFIVLPTPVSPSICVIHSARLPASLLLTTLSFHLSIRPSIHLSMRQSICTSVNLWFSTIVYESAVLFLLPHPFVPIHPSICLTIYPSFQHPDVSSSGRRRRSIGLFPEDGRQRTGEGQAG